MSSDDSGGALTIMEMTMPPGMGPPPHTHPGAETVFVEEGTLRYHIGDETVDGGPGSVCHIPAGTLEFFEPTGTGNLRVLVSYMPGGTDKLFAEAGEKAKAYELPPPPESPPDVERLAAIGEKYGMHIQAPS